MVPDQAVWSGALLLVCFLRTGGQALRIWIALAADRRSPVRYQISAWVYAATPSMCSSVQPRSGLELGPHSTTARGCGRQDSEAYALPRRSAYADFQGSAPAASFCLTRSSPGWLTRTPGWWKGAGGGAADRLALATAAGTSRGTATTVLTQMEGRRIGRPFGRRTGGGGG